jgi:hypothetical protein
MSGLEPFDHKAWSEFFYKIAHTGATPYELSFSPLAIRDWAEENWIHAVIWVVGYLLFCHYGVLFMENRKAWDIRYLLAVWNGALSLFSFMGVFRTVIVPHEIILSFQC